MANGKAIVIIAPMCYYNHVLASYLIIAILSLSTHRIAPFYDN